MEVSLVQGNIDQSIKWNPTFERGHSMPSWASPCEVLGPVKGWWFGRRQQHLFFSRTLMTITGKSFPLPGTVMITCSLAVPSYIEHNRLLNYMNSAFVSPLGNIVGRY